MGQQRRAGFVLQAIWPGGRVPYPGLAAFTELDAGVYFGRDAQVADLVRRLQSPQDGAAGRFVCVTGSSGAGKSSLIHAGMLPQLRERRWRVLPVVVPAGDPAGRLAAAFAQRDPAVAAQVVQRVRAGDADPGSVLGHLGRVRSGSTLLVVDQLEELVTLSGTRERDQFLDAIRDALAADPRLRVLAALRVESLPDLLGSSQPGLFAAPVTLGGLGAAELVAAVEKPAELAGMVFESGLVARIVDDAAGRDALPLLAYLLQELFLAAGRSRVATHEAYQELGGVAGALARQADAVFAGLAGEYGTDAVLDTLLRLVSMQGGEPARRLVPLSGLSAAERQVIAAFTDARLVVTGTLGGAPAVQAAHEALFRQWPPLRQLVAARAEQLRSREELERWADDWVRADRSPDYLLTGTRLALAGQWLDALAGPGEVTQDARTLVEASRARDSAYLGQVSASIGRYVLAHVGQDPELGILLAAAALEECPPVPVTRRALMAALAVSHGHQVLAGHASTIRGAAWSPDGQRIATASRDGTCRIWDAETAAPLLVLAGHEGMLEAVAWSPDETRVATASRDKTVRVWDARTGAMLVTLPDFRDMVHAVAWSPDAGHLAASSRDRLVRVFDTSSWQLTAALTGHADDIWGLAWSPCGTRLATASHDTTAVIWNAGTGQQLHVLRGHRRSITAASWSPDGAQLATSGLEGNLRIWDASDGRLLRTLIRSSGHSMSAMHWGAGGTRIACASGSLVTHIDAAGNERSFTVMRGHTDRVWAVAWSPNGQRILSGSDDCTVRTWNTAARGVETLLLEGHTDGDRTTVALSPDGSCIASGTPDGTLWLRHLGHEPAGRALRGHDGPVQAVAWSSDASVIATCSDDRTIRTWNPADGTCRVLARTSHTVEALAWAPDSIRLAAASKDALIRVFDTRSGTQAGQMAGHADWIGALDWSPHGRFIASGSDDRTIRIWDARTGELVRELPGHQNWVDGVAWSPDETLLASCSGDRVIKIWDTRTGQLACQLHGHEDRVWAIAWSPDGTRLASASDDRTVRTWDPRQGRELDIIGVHADHARNVAWLPDNRSVMSASRDRTIRIWDTEATTSALLTTARQRTLRALTPDERRAHLLPEHRDEPE